MIKDEKTDKILLLILLCIFENINNLWKVCRAVTVFKILYTALKHNHNKLHYKFIRKQSLWRYLWCSFEYDWQIFEDMSLYFMSEKHDYRKFCEDLYTKDSLFAWNFNYYSVELKIIVHLVILNQCNLYFKD